MEVSLKIIIEGFADGMDVEDPVVVRPCTAVLQKLNNQIFSLLNFQMQELLCHELVVLFENANGEQVNLLLIKWMKDLEKIFYGNIVAFVSGQKLNTVTKEHSNIAMARYVWQELSCLSLTGRLLPFVNLALFKPCIESEIKKNKLCSLGISLHH